MLTIYSAVLFVSELPSGIRVARMNIASECGCVDRITGGGGNLGLLGFMHKNENHDEFTPSPFVSCVLNLVFGTSLGRVPMYIVSAKTSER